MRIDRAWFENENGKCYTRMGEKERLKTYSSKPLRTTLNATLCSANEHNQKYGEILQHEIQDDYALYFTCCQSTISEHLER